MKSAKVPAEQVAAPDEPVLGFRQSAGGGHGRHG